MRSLGRIAVFVVLAASACDKANPASPTPTAASSQASAVSRVISLSGSLGFGAVAVGSAAELTLTIGNSGTGTLSVSGIAGPAGYSPNWTSGTIPPGGSQQVTVRFAPASAQSYDGTLTVNGDHTSGANTVALTGKGIAPVPALATLSGIATEPGAGALGGATIEVRDGPDARKWTTTDASGAFSLSGLQPGSVTVRAQKSGYADTDVRVTLAAGGVVSVTLSVPKSPTIPETSPAPPVPAPPDSTVPAPAPPAPVPAPPSTPSAAALEDQVLSLINDYRRSIGKPALVNNQVIWDQASGHSKDMAAKIVPFGHDGFEARIAAIKAALGSGGPAGENVAMGYDTAQAVVTAWLNSSGHRANIESNATRTGISAARSNGGDWYYTQIFY